MFVRLKANTCRLAFFPSARNKQLDIPDSHYVFIVRSQSCLELSSTVHQDSIFTTSFFLFLVSNYFVEQNAPEIVSMAMTLSGAWWNLPKRPGVKAKGLVDFFSQTVGILHSVSCLFVTELLRLPFSCYKFQLFAGDSVFFYCHYYFEEDVCDL